MRITLSLEEAKQIVRMKDFVYLPKSLVINSETLVSTEVRFRDDISKLSGVIRFMISEPERVNTKKYTMLINCIPSVIESLDILVDDEVTYGQFIGVLDVFRDISETMMNPVTIMELKEYESEMTMCLEKVYSLSEQILS